MKKFRFALFVLAFLLTFCGGCSAKVNFADYVSENRKNFYVYKSDTLTLKIFCTERETPFLLDGIRGDVVPIVEVFATFSTVPSDVFIKVEGHEGEMNYHSVGCYFHLSFSSQDFGKQSVDATLTFGQKTETVKAQSVLYDGVITGEQAVNYAREYDGQTFDSLVENNLFKGEILVRLLHDEKCFYYVGVCNRSGDIVAFLVDGETGTVIAKKQLNA